MSDSKMNRFLRTQPAKACNQKGSSECPIPFPFSPLTGTSSARSSRSHLCTNGMTACGTAQAFPIRRHDGRHR
jgi:hypothetical protein